ncbi:cobalt transporter [Dactylosporangium sp. NPDC050688]|uniref:cobalt transporter n=1 Tax=Dactylosporangium sp. NPDC050688 TaxID=3157217 RepID=UPI00340876E4
MNTPANSLAFDLFGASALGDKLIGFVDSPHFTPVAFGVAFAAGAAHAVGPGHGKSLAAAYLAGSGGRVRDAAWLGGSVAVMHTLSVFVLAVLWTFADLSGLIGLPRLTGSLQVLGGLLVVAVGVWLIRRHLLRAAAHTHTHPHEHGHAHSHQTTPGRPGLMLLGASGGLTPSPAAFLVLVAGFFSGRSVLALALVMVFALGLASVLFAVGLFALAGRSFVISQAGSRAAVRIAVRWAPVAAATIIMLIGCILTASAIANLATAS